MKNRNAFLIVLSLFTLWSGSTTVWSQVYSQTAFNFEGRLYESNAPANGPYDFEFRVFEAETNGMQAGPLVSITGVPVENGYFSATPDFGANIFTGAPRFLEIRQRMSGNGAFVALSKRVPLFSTPQAIFAYSANNAAIATTVSQAGITAASMGPNSVTSGAIADGSVCAEDLCTNLLDLTFWKLQGNADTVAGIHFLGTTDDQPLELKVFGKRALRLEPHAISPNILGGSPANSIGAGSGGAVIVGGGALSDPVFGVVPNRILGTNRYDFIGGGLGNTSSGGRNSIVGGQENTMEDANSSVIAGGIQNLIRSPVDSGAIVAGSGNTLSNQADSAAIVAGLNNLGTNLAVFIGAGEFNLAGGAYSVIAGGRTNRALGESSVIAGGTSNTVSGLGSSIGGGQRNYVISANGTVAGGFANTNLASFASIGGGNVNRANGLAAAIAGGSGNVVNGAYSTLGGGNGNSVNGPASMVGGGTSNRVDASASVIAGGQLNYIGGATNAVAAILGGNANTNLGSSAAIAGGERNLALGAWSAIPGGKQAVARSHGELAFAGGQLDTLGDAQVSTFVLRRRFTGNGDLFLDGNAGLQRISVPNGAVWTLRFQVSAVSVTGMNFASYEVSGMVANVGGTVTFQMVDGPGVPMTTTARPIFETAGAIDWLATPYTTGTPGDNTLRIAVFAGEEVKWCARIDATEVTR